MADDKALIAKMAAWGCDTAKAVERFCDNEELYVECLNIFSTDKGFTELEEALNAEDYEKAFMAAHTLKGVAANLGAGPLQTAVTTVSDALKAGDYTLAKQHYPELVQAKKEYDALLKD